MYFIVISVILIVRITVYQKSQNSVSKSKQSNNNYSLPLFSLILQVFITTRDVCASSFSRVDSGEWKTCFLRSASHVGLPQPDCVVTSKPAAPEQTGQTVCQVLFKFMQNDSNQCGALVPVLQRTHLNCWGRIYMRNVDKHTNCGWEDQKILGRVKYLQQVSLPDCFRTIQMELHPCLLHYWSKWTS